MRERGVAYIIELLDKLPASNWTFKQGRDGTIRCFDEFVLLKWLAAARLPRTQPA
jgi:hypothetical protein